MDKQLPARPNLVHLRGQAKALLAELRNGDASAAQAFIEHLPSARDMTPTTLPLGSYRLADAQSVVARKSGFASWPALARHVDWLRALEGDWRFARLEVDGQVVPETMLGMSRILIDGDRFRTESPSGNYEGVFTIDVEASPPEIDIEFVEGPEAGNWCHGIFEVRGNDEIVFCLGLNGTRPPAFATQPGSGFALEHLRRVSKARPENVNGGTHRPDPAPTEDPAAFEAPVTPLLERLQGDWSAVELVTDGDRIPQEMLAYGARTMTGNHVRVVFGGRNVIDARVRIDESTTPIAIDYLDVQRHTVTYGILEWVDDEVRFLTAPAGAPRPRTFADAGTLSRWRRR